MVEETRRENRDYSGKVMKKYEFDPEPRYEEC